MTLPGQEGPLISVALIAGSDQAALADTMASLSAQRDADCEVLVVADGRLDGAALDQCLRAEPRSRPVQSGHPLDAALALQHAIDAARGRAMTVVEPGDRLFPGALTALGGMVTASDDVVMAHAYWAPRACLGGVSRLALRRHRAALLEHVPPDLDHRHALAARGNVLQALPTFRLDALRRAGGLSGGGASLDEVLYGAARAVLGAGEARVIPRLLCSPAGDRRGWRLRPRPMRLRLAAPRDWWQRLGRARERLGLWARTARGWRRLRHLRSPYELVAALLPCRLLEPRLQRPPRRADPRVAYVLWRYPALSETFIRREVQALRDRGLAVEVVAREPDDPPLPDDPRSPAGRVTYHGATDDDRARALLLALLRRHPVRALGAWLWLVAHRYHPHKTWWRDRNTLFDAAHLARTLHALGVTHVHAPWADQSATLASVAARLLGLPFSVQARAAEIHRGTEPNSVVERLRTARFVVTNSAYNDAYLRGLAGLAAVPVHVVYNGLDLHRFRPAERARAPGPWRLLTVARLAEYKGLGDLLAACRALREEGVGFTCDIIGGPEDPGYTAEWVALRRRHTALGLEECVRFHGAQPFSTVLQALEAADVFVLPCVTARDGAHDVTPNALLEAMAMALPVISTPVGAIPEIVEHEVSGLLVPSRDPAALLAALRRLLRDDGLRRRLGQGARRRIEERFDVDRNAQRRIALFRSSGPEEARESLREPAERYA